MTKKLGKLLVFGGAAMLAFASRRDIKRAGGKMGKAMVAAGKGVARSLKYMAR